jgi:glycosyltransferase involved in cell wall biosynthesis
MPEITVGMSSYNRKDLLREALQSVVTQQNADFEVIVVDDGSTDGSAEMVEQEFPQVRVIRKTNGGDASAKNMAAANAQGKYLVFLDSDDIMLPGALEMLMRPLRQNDGACAYGQYTRIDADGAPIPGKLKLDKFPSGDVLPDLIRRIIVCNCGFMVPTADFAKAGGFNTEYKVGYDYYFALKMALNHKIFSVDAPVFKRRRHSGNISGCSFVKELQILTVFEDFSTAHPELQQRLGKEIRKRISTLALRAAKQGKKENSDPAKVRALQLKSWQNNRTFKTFWHGLLGR